jgi:hypothetical protein
MQNRTYAQLLDTIEALAGVDSFDPSSEEGKILSFVNRRAFAAYSASSVWERFVVVGEERTLSAGQLVPFTETAKNNIGEFNRIHRKQPFLNSSALEYDFYVDADGAHVMNISPTDSTSVWVTYKKEFTDYTTSSTDIPFEWFEFLAHGAYADFLRMDGQLDAAMVEEDRAKEYLMWSLEKAQSRNNKSNIGKRIRTYGTTQRRG